MEKYVSKFEENEEELSRFEKVDILKRKYKFRSVKCCATCAYGYWNNPNDELYCRFFEKKGNLGTWDAMVDPGGYCSGYKG